MVSHLLELLHDHRLIAIVRGQDPEASLESLRTLAGCGVEIAEVSLSGTDALEVLRKARREFGAEMRLGAGTVLSATDTEAAVQAGVSFIVSPSLGAGVRRAAELGVPVVCGALSPTEVHSAWLAGAVAVKVFPASLGGPSYIRALRDPYPGVPLVPVGGVGIDQAASFLEAGATAVGIGGPLLGDAPNGGDQRALAARVDQLIQILRVTERSKFVEDWNAIR